MSVQVKETKAELPQKGAKKTKSNCSQAIFFENFVHFCGNFLLSRIQVKKFCELFNLEFRFTFRLTFLNFSEEL